MKSSLCISAFSAVLISAAATVAQANDSPWYVGAHGEFLWVEDTELERDGVNVGDLDFDMEYAAAAAIGYQPSGQGMWDNTRYELELMYRQTDFDQFDSVLAPGGIGGSIDTYTAMVNAYYDFPTGTGFEPYVGAGIGYAHHIYDTITIQVDDTDNTFAYQAMVGVAYTPQAYPYLTFNFGYRYYATEDISVTNDSGQKFEQEFSSHALEYGIHYRF